MLQNIFSKKIQLFLVSQFHVSLNLVLNVNLYMAFYCLMSDSPCNPARFDKKPQWLHDLYIVQSPAYAFYHSILNYKGKLKKMSSSSLKETYLFI